VDQGAGLGVVRPQRQQQQQLQRPWCRAIHTQRCCSQHDVLIVLTSPIFTRESRMLHAFYRWSRRPCVWLSVTPFLQDDSGYAAFTWFVIFQFYVFFSDSRRTLNFTRTIISHSVNGSFIILFCVSMRMVLLFMKD